MSTIKPCVIFGASSISTMTGLAMAISDLHLWLTSIALIVAGIIFMIRLIVKASKTHNKIIDDIDNMKNQIVSLKDAAKELKDQIKESQGLDKTNVPD